MKAYDTVGFIEWGGCDDGRKDREGDEEEGD